MTVFISLNKIIKQSIKNHRIPSDFQAPKFSFWKGYFLVNLFNFWNVFFKIAFCPTFAGSLINFGKYNAIQDQILITVQSRISIWMPNLKFKSWLDSSWEFENSLSELFRRNKFLWIHYEKSLRKAFCLI